MSTFAPKAEYVEQYFMHVIAIIVQAAVKLFYVVCNASLAEGNFSDV